ncbi:MAG: hypothetical protein JXA21_10795 [Anaerolineae bacterium]|nr:hypothetical protein [Anaerolineae bacterium]
MYRGSELEQQVYEPVHIRQVMAEIEYNLPQYLKGFAQQPLRPVFQQRIEEYEKEREVYRDYLDLEALEEYEFDPNAFKSHTRKRCPIIRRCLMSKDEVMKAYKRSFNDTSGRAMLDTVRNIAEFGREYVSTFDDDEHENAAKYSDLGLEPLNEAGLQCLGVIGYGIQSSLLFGQYARCFAHRSQNAVWSLYFLSGRKEFGLQEGSEFLMVDRTHGTCEQNFFYPAELFGFYALWAYVLLESACQDHKVAFDPHYRYVYLSAFCDHVAERHREDINTYKWSSEHVESRPYFWL